MDDCSDDGTGEAVRQHFGQVEILRNQSSLGCAASRNLGIAAARGEVLVFLDDDAYFPFDEATQRIIAAFGNDPRIGIIACAIADTKTGRPGRREIPRRDKAVPPDPTDVAYFTGAGYAARRVIFQEVGGFDSAFFISNEELDLSFRLMKAGWRIVYLPGVMVMHECTASNCRKWYEPFYTLRNRIGVALRYLPWTVAVVHVSCWIVHSLLFSIRHRCLGEFLKALLAAGPFWWRRPPRHLPLRFAELRRIQALSGRVYY